MLYPYDARHSLIEWNQDLIAHLDELDETRFSAVSRPMNPPPTTTARVLSLTV